MGRKNRSRRSKKDFENSNLDVAGSCVQSSCIHVNKAVNLSNVKKVLKEIKNFNCQLCENSKTNEEQRLSHALLCLYCGNLGCDYESTEKHSLLHFQTPHSDAHSVALDLSNNHLWCYQCEESVNYEGNKKVLECVKFIDDTRESMTRKRTLDVLSSLINSDQLKNNGTSKSKLDQPTSVDKIVKIFKIKGLINLGNTCFLNSVLQSLVQTTVLYELLSSREAKGLSSSIGFFGYDDCKSDNHDALELPPIDIILPEMGPLSHAFCAFLKDYSNKNENINPNQLLGQICKRSPQFRGALQQDSHELLRHLLDGLKNEEIKRYQAGILTAFKMDSKTNPKSVDEETKRLVKAYARCLPSTAIDHIFSGQLISTVLCKECGMSSQVFEPFLDLSLPVTEDKGNRPGTIKRCVNDDNCSSEIRPDKPSKHQEKKSKKQAKRSAKLQRQKIKNKKAFSIEDGTKVIEHDEEPNDDSLQDSLNLDSKNSMEKDDTEISDADVEDNAESGSTCSVGMRNDSAPAIVEGQELPNDEDNSNVFEENKIDKDLINKLNQLTLHEEVPVVKVNGLCSSDDNYEGIENLNEVETNNINNAESEEPAKQIGKTKWMSKSLTTLATRYQPVPQECSIYSCLNQFTAPELLTGSNKFGCENCTRQKKERDSVSRDSDDKSVKKCSVVYTNASKQLLIFSPPAILTLHLKRFQQAGYSLKKVNRHVDFPLILNLAPFCSSICLGLPTFKKYQHKVLYYLYAVVEHSGRLTGGHYTAFVRMCPKDENSQAFLNLKQVYQKDINKLIEEMQTKLCNCEETSCTENLSETNIKEDINSKHWYHVSDSSFREVTEEFVLGCQAYLLFYKRIL